MVSKLSIYSSKFKKSLGEQGSDSMASLTHKFTQLKHQIQSERYVAVGEKLEKNSKRIQTFVSDLETLAASRKDASTISSNDSDNFLSLRMDSPLCKVSGLVQGFADRDDCDSEEVVFSSTAKLPHAEKIPPYTTWIFLERNQRMADDQSVLGRRRIYYDQHDSEALICSDSEEELGALEGEKYGFSEGEDRILRVALQECEVSDEVLDTLTKFVGGTIPEIQVIAYVNTSEPWKKIKHKSSQLWMERCNMLREKDPMIEKQNLKSSGEEGSEYNVLLDKSLDAALDSFDNLFCRRCLVFDCRLHGCSQNLIHPSEKQTYPNDPEEDRKPCGNQCYLQLNDLKDMPKSSDLDPMGGFQSKAYGEGKSVFSSYAAEPESEGKPTPLQLVSDDLLSSSSKKLKLAVSDTLDHGSTLGGQVTGVGGSYEYGLQMSTSGSMQILHIQDSDMLYCAPEATGNKISDDVGDKGKDINEYPSKQACDPFIKLSNGWNQWKPFEKDLYLKGLEIFGRNSCYIARNLLSGLKTCKEVSRYMYGAGAILPRGSSSMGSSLFEDCGKADLDNMEPEMPVKSRICRKRGRARKVKSSWKSAGHPSLWRRIVDGKDQPFKQYVPCVCESSCGKQCSCLQSGTCCEKYCGCSKSCKNRFRGCHCAKSQCKSRQCPCFAAGRECDPDVCRNCWVSCGDGSLGEPPRRGDGQCGNMKLLLRQQQRILLTKSDVAGWGAFLKNSVNKNDYLGEYTGELISHREADKRGKIYDRANSSFLFDLNDQYVLDAYRKGDKLKFANHSSNPNCYAKVMLVAGDHRVGIYANERIEGGEELFYDYRYGPDQAPAWARKPEGSKRDGSPIFLGRAKKHRSG